MFKKSLNVAAAGAALLSIILLLVFAVSLLPEQEDQPGGPVGSAEAVEEAVTITTQPVENGKGVPTATAAPLEPVFFPSPDGRWTAILNRVAGSLEIEDSQGMKSTLFPEGGTVNDAKWSPDGKRLAVTLNNLPKGWQIGDETTLPPEIHVVDFDGGAFLISESFYRANSDTAGGRIILGGWSPDNQRILFWLGSMSESLRADGFPLWVLDLIHLQAVQLSEATLLNPAYQSWAPDGSALVFTDGGYRSAQVNKWLSLYDLMKGQVTTLVSESELVPGKVAWSPVGDRIAFAAVEAGETGDEWADWMGWDNPAIQARRIYLVDTQTGGYHRLNATEAYQDAPRWSAGGETLYYVQIDGEQAVVMAADPASGEAQPLPGCQAPLPSGAGYYGQSDWSGSYEACPETRPSVEGQIYTDPAGQFRLRLPAGWQPGDEEGFFIGEDGDLRAGYLPEMAFMDRAYRVCERLANAPDGPIGRALLYPLQYADACLLIPYPETSAGQARLVVENAAGEPEQRYFFIETDEGRIDDITASLELLNPLPERDAFPYPSGPLRPEDEAFWEQTRPLPGELTVEEYAVVEASVDSPTRFEFNRRIPDEVFQKRADWRGGFRERRLAGNNALLEPFGYALKVKQGAVMELYELHRGDELFLDNINEIWPVSVSASGSDFALVVEILNGGFRLARKDGVESWDMSASQYFPPVFYGEELMSVGWDGARSQAQVMQGDRQVYAFSAAYLVAPPVKDLWSYEGSWLLEVDGFLIQDGENLNERLGYEEIFGWQLLGGKPFYYFRKGPRIGISYDGRILPVYYDDVPHYRCCEPAAFNIAGNEDMVWFYGLREGMWHYVEIGRYDE